MPTMTQPWPQVVARYDAFEGKHKSIRALGSLAQRISQSPLAIGLHVASYPVPRPAAVVSG